MQELTKNDLRYVVSHLPKDVRNLIKSEKLFLGGGFIRETISGEKPKDIDLFGADEKALKRVADKLETDRDARKYQTDNAITLLTPPRMPVQFIIKWLYSEPEKLVESFDFTVCQAIVWYDSLEKKWQSMVHPDFYSDLAAKRLVYTFPEREEAAGGSIMRVLKFLRRGYNIQAHSLSGVMARVFQAIEKHEEREGNNSEKWFSTVIEGLLREVDPLTVIDGIDFGDEHQKLDDF